MSETHGKVALVCTCDGRWYPKTADEMSTVGRQHDDSPWTNHIVRCELDGKAIGWDKALELLRHREARRGV